MGSFTNRKQIVTLDICLSVSSIQLNHLRSLLSACPSFSHTVGINFSPSWVWDWFVKTLMNGILKKSLEFLKVEEAQIRFENKLCFVNFRKLANGKVLCLKLSNFPTFEKIWTFIDDDKRPKKSIIRNPDHYFTQWYKIQKNVQKLEFWWKLA